MQLDGVYRHADNIVTRKVMDETLLVPVSSEIASMENLYTLNETAALVWNAFDGRMPLSEIACQVEQSYDAPLSDINADLLEVVRGLADIGLIIRADTKS